MGRTEFLSSRKLFVQRNNTHSINNKLYGRLGFGKFCESRVELNTKKINKKDGIKANNLTN